MTAFSRFFAYLCLVGLPTLAGATDAAWIRPYADIDSGDTAWILVSALLVLFMTLPGLALFLLS